jgi:FdhE protein
VPERLPPPARSESREVVELKELRVAQPELAPAIDMQLALIEMTRRVQARVPLPWTQQEPRQLTTRLQAGHPVVRWEDIPIEWSDFRLALRQTADILHRFDALDRDEHQRVLALGRESERLEPLMSAWYIATAQAHAGGQPTPVPQDAHDLDQVLVLALRPFLVRCAEAFGQRLDLSSWQRGYCPFCGWEPDFAAIVPSAERRLVCGRCTAQWPFDPLACPFCGNRDRARITSFATRDGRYRVAACDVCHRYVKAYDGRYAPRPVLVAVDAIATLPLDAAAMQRGYRA